MDVLASVDCLFEPVAAVCFEATLRSTTRGFRPSTVGRNASLAATKSSNDSARCDERDFLTTFFVGLESESVFGADFLTALFTSSSSRIGLERYLSDCAFVLFFDGVCCDVVRVLDVLPPEAKPSKRSGPGALDLRFFIALAPAMEACDINGVDIIRVDRTIDARVGILNDFVRGTSSTVAAGIVAASASVDSDDDCDSSVFPAAAGAKAGVGAEQTGGDLFGLEAELDDDVVGDASHELGKGARVSTDDPCNVLIRSS